MPVINVTVIRSDGERTPLVAGPKQLHEFEATKKKGLGSAFSGSDIYLSDLYYIAWLADKAAAKREGRTIQLFDAWLEEITDVEMSGNDDPT
jgi:hypothetical protein